MSLTGALLVCSKKPAGRLGIIATPRLAAEADELARTIGRAWAELTIPAEAYQPLATAIATLVMGNVTDDDPTALEVLEDGLRRIEDGVLEHHVKPRLTKALGYDAADQALEVLQSTGRRLWTALGDRRIPDEPRTYLAQTLSLVADANSPARDLYPGGLR